MSERRHPHVVNIEEVQPTESTNGRFAYKHRALARAVGGRQIGCGMVELAPGKTAWPAHWHCANEEAIYVVSGTGTARIGDASIAIRAGDYLAFPVGPAWAHQTTNTGTEPLVYLVFSTMNSTEVVGYPDSKKLGASSAEWAADGSRKLVVRALFKEDSQVGYFDGENLEE